MAMGYRTKNLAKRNRQKASKEKVRQKKKIKGGVIGDVQDKELITVHHLRKRRTCTRANINLSGKKKRKLIKQLKHMATEKNKMDVCEMVPEPKKKRNSVSEPLNSEVKQIEISKTDQDSKDIEMADSDLK